MDRSAGVVWIRRSLRRYDNTALVEAAERHDEVVPVYVVDDALLNSESIGGKRLKFWHDSLRSLEESFGSRDGERLVVRRGDPVEEVRAVCEEVDAERIYYNNSYTPYARCNEESLRDLGVSSEGLKDVVISEKREITTQKGDPYQVYSYYRDKWFDVEKPEPESPEGFVTPEVESSELPSREDFGISDVESEFVGGREAGTERLEGFVDRIDRYDDERDYPALDSTSKLSPHLKFGTVSVREAFWASERVREKTEDEDKDDDGARVWQEELAWRDFYFQMLWNHPETTEKAFIEKYRSIDWGCEDSDWRAFIEGETGFPFVDAGMRQLKQTGWMHNRPRMVTASFAAKDLRADWRRLHDHLKKHLVDADTPAMVGGIQWAYSVGTDAQPYFRVFNPWTQGEKYDPDGEYIRRWIPELREVDDSYIHRPYESPKFDEIDYPSPILDHDEERKRSVELFERHG
ncbi:MAG: deoxyribodipyrimidine photo-lyase [Halobacteria archaeon]|nr:deoxyribodipyrimidine photo-lyase [Halobacteria archaeon]